MGNIYYRHPRWRVSPYAGFGVGAFFHDGAFTSTVTLEDESGAIGFPTEPFRVTVAYEDSRFAYKADSTFRWYCASSWERARCGGADGE